MLVLCLAGVASLTLTCADGRSDAGGPDTGSATHDDASPAVDAEIDAHDSESGENITPAPSRPGCSNPETAGATAGCLEPTQPPAYYVEQALAYFDTLDVSASRDSVPNYAIDVARWEWPPWLLLTALGREDMIQTATTLRSLDPSTVPTRDCRFFDVQPFARCYVVFDYDGESCPIYEEFTFDDTGQVTFIEAWSDQSELLPQDRDDDPWAEDPSYPRLSTRIPGLGAPDATFDVDSSYMRDAAAADPDVADFAERAPDWWSYWFQEVAAAGTEYFAIGCGWQ